MAGQSASLTAGSRDASSTGDRRAESFGLELRRVIAAWDALPGGDYRPHEVERWLATYMWPAIVAARATIALSDHQNAPTDDATGQRSGLSP